MISFGRWLGKENGKTMVSEALQDATKEQARSVITTYCLIFGIEVDTSDWTDIMDYVYEYYNSWFDSYEEMDGYFAELLV